MQQTLWHFTNPDFQTHVKHEVQIQHRSTVSPTADAIFQEKMFQLVFYYLSI